MSLDGSVSGNAPSVGGEKPAGPVKIDRAEAAKKFQNLMANPKAGAIPGQQSVVQPQQTVQGTDTGAVSGQTAGGDQRVSGEQAKQPLLDYNDLFSFFNTPKQEVKPDVDIEEFKEAPTDPEEIKRMKAGMNKHFTQTNQKNAELNKQLQGEIDKYKSMYEGMSQQISELKGMLQAFQMVQPQGIQPQFMGQVPGQDVQGNYNFNPDAPFTELQGQGIDPVLASRLAALERNNQEILAYREAQERQQSIGKVRSYYQSLVKDDPLLSAAGEEVEGFIISAAIAGRTPLVDAIQSFHKNVRGLVGGTPETMRKFISNLPDSDMFLREALAIAQERYTGAKRNMMSPGAGGESIVNPALSSVKQETSGRLTAEGTRAAAAKLWTALTGKGAQA